MLALPFSPDPTRGLDPGQHARGSDGETYASHPTAYRSEVWEMASDDSIVVTRVEDYMIQITIEDASECPIQSMTNNGIPVVFKIADD